MTLTAAAGQHYAKSAQQQAKEYKGPAKSYFNSIVSHLYLFAGAGAGTIHLPSSRANIIMITSTDGLK